MLGPWYTCELRLSSEREAHLREEKPLNPQLFYFALSFAPSLPPPTLVLGAHTTIEHFFKNTSMRVITSEERWLVGATRTSRTCESGRGLRGRRDGAVGADNKAVQKHFSMTRTNDRNGTCDDLLLYRVSVERWRSRSGTANCFNDDVKTATTL